MIQETDSKDLDIKANNWLADIVKMSPNAIKSGLKTFEEQYIDNNRIKKFDSSGNYLKSFGGPGSGCSQWRSARQFDIKGNIIYISDTNNNRFVTLSLDGACRTTRYNSLLVSTPTAMAVGGGWAWASGGRRGVESILVITNQA